MPALSSNAPWLRCPCLRPSSLRLCHHCPCSGCSCLRRCPWLRCSCRRLSAVLACAALGGAFVAAAVFACVLSAPLLIDQNNDDPLTFHPVFPPNSLANSTLTS